MDLIQGTFPIAEVLILGYCNIHNNWEKYLTHSDAAVLEAKAFAITRNLTLLVENPTRITGNFNKRRNILGLFCLLLIQLNRWLPLMLHIFITTSCLTQAFLTNYTVLIGKN